MGVKESFDKLAAEYNKHRRRLFPCYDDLYQLPLKYLRIDKINPEILDIGAGTGLFSSFIRSEFPESKLTLIDFSENMLSVAKEHFGDTDISYIVADYTDYHFERTFDFIISAFSIHHLPARVKKSLYRKCYDWLNPGGIFINIDLVSGSTPEMDQLFHLLRDEHYISAGVTDEQMKIVYQQMRLDDPSRVDEQLEWLSNAGFPIVDCIYKYNNYATLYAKKISDK